MTNNEPVVTIFNGDPFFVLDAIIVPARFGGLYEGGAWLAFPEGPLPEEAFERGGAAFAWWEDHGSDIIGRGDTPNDALLDLVARAKQAGVLEDRHVEVLSVKRKAQEHA